MQTAFMGIAVGLGGGMAVNRLMGSLLFGVRPHDPATLVTVAATIAAVATRVLASGVARGAARSH
jgi:choline-glycine betaine transporter